MNRTLKLLFVLAVLALVAGTVIAWKNGLLPFGGSGSANAAAAAQAAQAPVPVSVATVMEKPVTEWDEFSGRIRAINHVDIRPQVSGIIEEIHFADGQLVKQGDLLFVIDPRPFAAEVARTEAVLAGAQAKVAWAETNLNRDKQLIQTHAVSQLELDQYNDDYLEAAASVQAAQAALQTAKLNLAYTTITAPVDGRVSRAEITVGNLVEAGNNAPVLTSVVTVSPVYVEFEMDEQSFLKYAATGAAGNTNIDNIPVAMGLANEDGFPHQGKLESIDNQLDVTSGTIRIRAIFDNPDNLLTPGLYARVRTGSASEVPAILVDDRAIGTDQDKKYVMVVDSDNHAQYRAVTLGPVVNGLRIVRSGLQKGERIVVDGLQRVRPNSLVSPTDVAMDQNVSPADLTASSR